MTRPDVIVVGGGIGGLSAAYALTRKGLRVRVLERSEEFGEVGAGMQIAPNCTRILHEYGLLDEAKKLGVLVDNMIMKDALDGSVLTRLDLHDTERRYGFPYMVIHRTDLHALFLGGCRDAGVELLTGQHVTGYSSGEAGAVTGLATPVLLTVNVHVLTPAGFNIAVGAPTVTPRVCGPAPSRLRIATS